MGKFVPVSRKVKLSFDSKEQLFLHVRFINNIKLVTSGKYYLILTNYYPITIVLVEPRWIGSCSISCFCSDGED